MLFYPNYSNRSQLPTLKWDQGLIWGWEVFTSHALIYPPRVNHCFDWEALQWIRSFGSCSRGRYSCVFLAQVLFKGPWMGITIKILSVLSKLSLWHSWEPKLNVLWTGFRSLARMKLLAKFLDLEQDIESFASCVAKMSPITDLMEEFDEMLPDSDVNSPASAFWMFLISMIQTFLNFQKSIKVGNWILHLQSIIAMLP